MSTLLDPRFKHLTSWGLTAEEETQATKDLITEVTRLCRQNPIIMASTKTVSDKECVTL